MKQGKPGFRSLSISLLFLFFCAASIAQKNDYIWIAGYGSESHIDSPIVGTNVGNIKLDYNYIPVKISNDSLTMNFDFTNTSYSNNDGLLQFYTNGIYINNILDEIIENGDSLNSGYFEATWRNYMNSGYRLYQGIIALQYPEHPDQYFLLYSFYDTLSYFPWQYTSRILTSMIDMSVNADQGQVISKDVPLIEDSLGFELAATRHANGRDWWMLVQRHSTNCFYRVLIDNTGVHLIPNLNCLGQSVPNGSICVACFSPDGSKYVYLSNEIGLNIYDFDRCAGELSNPINIPMPIYIDSSLEGMGVAISSNSRYLYVTATTYVYQFDLWAQDIATSIQTVAVYDGFKLPFGSYFNTAQIGPDGKIYISCGNTEADYHVINNPDSSGVSCDFLQHGLLLPNVSNCVPSYPNYRLGPLIGSACDTLSGLSEVARAQKETILRVYPNPATRDVVIDYGFTDWSKAGAVSFEISNELGQSVYEQVLPQYSGYQKLDVTKFANGFYTVFIKRSNGIIATTKFAKE